MIGETIGQYRIDAELGRGGRGVVYRAFDQQLQRNMALKVLHEGVTSRAEQRSSILAEARAASPLNHPGIATIYEVGEQGELGEAQDYQARALALDPPQIWANLFMPSVLIKKGDPDRAERGIRTAEQILGTDQMLGTMEALIWARRGEDAKAEQTVLEALSHGTSKRHTTITRGTSLRQCTRSWEGRVKPCPGSKRRRVWALPNHPLFWNDPHLASLQDHPGFLGLMSSLRSEHEAFRGEFSRV